MAVARLAAATVAGAAVTAVGYACWMLTLPREETWFFAPRPFNGSVFVAGCGLLGLVWAITGAVVVGLRPRNILGWIVLGVGASQAWAVALTAHSGYGLLESSPGWGAYFGPALYLPGWLIPPSVLLALYPDGRLPSKAWRWPVGAALVSIMVLTLCIPFPVVEPAEVHGWGMVPRFPQRLADVLMPGPRVYDIQVFLSADPNAVLPVAPLSWARWSSIGSLVFKPVLVLSMLAIWVGTVRRMIRARPPRRQQLALLVCVVMPFLAASLLVTIRFANVLIFASLLLVPVAVAVGVLRYRLLGIEAVLRRGLVYGVYTFVVVAAYLGASFAAGAIVGAALDSRPLPGVVAAAAVAVALAPARNRIQRTADRLVYGQRRDPLAALTTLGRRLAGNRHGDLLTDALHAVAAAVRAPAAALTTPAGRTLGHVGVHRDGDAPTDLPLHFGGALIGHLHVFPRRSRESYTPADARLLAALALQMAVVVQAFQLTEQLEAERDRVITAAESERERLRADLHDGLGPALSGVRLGLQAILDRADHPLLRRIQEEVAVAITDVRRILDNQRPAALDTMTLIEAIRRHAQTISANVPVHVCTTDLPPAASSTTKGSTTDAPLIPAAVENAAYRITTEALTNAARHARATGIRVDLAIVDNSLRITVADDGCGLISAAAGIGLTSMRRRAEQLGGRMDLESAATGTTVRAVLPLSRRAPPVAARAVPPATHAAATGSAIIDSAGIHSAKTRSTARGHS